MPDVIAIDVVARPNPELEALAIQLSESLKPSGAFTLNRHDRFPHASLFMAHIQRGDLPAIEFGLAKIAGATGSIEASCDFETYESPSRPILSGIAVERTAELQQLHESVVASTRNFGGHAVEPDSYVLDADETGVREITLNWTLDFIEKSSFDKFHPHVTLGFGLPQNDHTTWPVQGLFDRLAVFQLGNFNTCRKLIAEWPLQERA